MARLPDFNIQKFDGGLVLNKSDFELERTEFSDTLNMEFDEVGKAKRRRGIQQFGDTISGTPVLDDSFIFTRHTLGGTPTTHHIVVSRASSAVIRRIVGSYNTAAVASGASTITVADTGRFAASGNAEINGDIFAYTGKTGTTFTTVTGISRAHPAFSSIHQISSSVAANADTRAGVYFSVLNNLLYINGRLGGSVYNGSTTTAVSDTDEPGGIFATNYRDRIYVAGSGIDDGNGTRNGDTRRVSFSVAGGGTTLATDMWGGSSGQYLINFFDVEDDRGESISGFQELNNVLGIFKPNSVFTYDEVQLVQRLWNVGAYNHKVIQKIGETIFTFCPQGVFATNLTSAQKISDPVDKYLRNFRPDYSAIFGRVPLNTFAGQFEDKYYLYLGNSTEPEERSDVVLVYDTIRKNWTVHDNFTNFTHFGSFKGFEEGLPAPDTTRDQATQHGESLFSGNTGGKYFRLFDGRFLDSEATRIRRGTDYIANLISDDTGNPISTVLKTKFYDLGNPSVWKEFGYVTILIDKGDFDITYRLDKGNQGITDWITLGNFKEKVSTTSRLAKGKNDGYRIQFQITSNTKDTISAFGGLILKDINTQDERRDNAKR